MIGATSHIASRTSGPVVGPSEADPPDERSIPCHHRRTRSSEVNTRTWHRLGLLVLGLIVLFAGLAAWSIEDTYGHGLDFTLRGRNVYEAGVDDPVFEGSPQEARDYMERRRAAVERNFVVPGLIVALGVVLVIAAFLPWQRLRGG
jgi:hypothetical protein